MTRIGQLKLANLVMQSDLPQWVKETPCHIRQNAIFEPHPAYTASCDARFRSVRDPSQTIKFKDSNFSKGTWYSQCGTPTPRDASGGLNIMLRAWA
jgi:putative transposase